jgi:N-acetylglutamate synthase-like GNAT family acetyltransferase
MLRRALADDRQAILAVPHAALARLPMVATTVDGVGWWRAPAETLAALIAAGRYYVAVQDGRVVAGAGWEPHRDIADTAVLRSVILDLAHRGRAVGLSLMQMAEDDAVAAGFQHILVSAAPAATAFYRRLGYVGADADDLVLDAGLRVAYQRMWKRAA